MLCGKLMRFVNLLNTLVLYPWIDLNIEHFNWSQLKQLEDCTGMLTNTYIYITNNFIWLFFIGSIFFPKNVLS